MINKHSTLSFKHNLVVCCQFNQLSIMLLNYRRMQDSSSFEMKSLQKENEYPFYDRATRVSTCCAKNRFDSRFPIVKEQQKVCVCAFCCGFMWRFCTNCERFPWDKEELERMLPIRQPDFTPKKDKIRYTWVGHSTAVISIGEQANLMIDPVFSNRASPFQCVGPARYREPACQISELPKIHAVFMSHDHYDHLDEAALNQLETRHQPLFCAGLESRNCFPKGCTLEQFDWTETKKLNINGDIYEITFVPAAHRAQRWLCDVNTRLWGGFVIKTPQGKKIFYSGDTAYCEIFKDIRHIFGPIDLAILPIGAYEPMHLLQFMHVNPEESVKIHREVRSKKSVAVHWGTFPLGLEAWHAPKEDLEVAKEKYRIDKEEFVTIQHGESLEIDL